MKVKQTQVDKSFSQIAFMAGVAMPLLTLPQLYTIWWHHTTAGVSLITWSCYTLISLIFAIFGIKNKQELLVVTYLPMFIIEAFIIIGLIVYR